MLQGSVGKVLEGKKKANMHISQVILGTDWCPNYPGDSTDLL